MTGEEYLERLHNLRKVCFASPPTMNMVEWAERYRVLPPESSVPGPWRTDLVEVAREPMLTVTLPDVRMMTVQAPAQLFKTEIANNYLGYSLHVDPKAIIFAMPTKESVERWVKLKYERMIESIPELSKYDLTKTTGEERGRDKTDRKRSTLYLKKFEGGSLSIVGSSKNQLASQTGQVVIVDEFDRFTNNIDGEGDPIELLKKRTTTFPDSLILLLSTPTEQGKSRIHASWLQSDRREYNLYCRKCKTFNVPRLLHLKFPKGKPELAHLHCPKCDHRWSEGERLRAIAEGKWIATQPFTGHAGFKTSSLCGPFRSAVDIAREYVESKNDHIKERSFYNLTLGETHASTLPNPSVEALYENRGQRPFHQPIEETGYITCGVDIQTNRIEYLVVGWSEGPVAQILEYRQIFGNTDLPEVWTELKFALEGFKVTTPKGRIMRIHTCFIDAGYNTQRVYTFTQDDHWLVATRGLKHQKTLTSGARDINIKKETQKLQRGGKYITIGTDLGKELVYSSLRLTESFQKELGTSKLKNFPRNFTIFSKECSIHFFKSLVSESRVIEIDKHLNEQYVWVKHYNQNEVLDLMVLNRSAIYHLGGDRLSKLQWKQRTLQSLAPRTRSAKNGPPRTDLKPQKKRRKVQKFNPYTDSLFVD